ncbi:CHAD domain-containing protein [Photobacterium lucens]|uniref:CHAD domain-containing protein n=1 Tax=Photobacterium lucens TaxID=2562949 RepID=UPI00137023EB|nr:CHAD domain-containing protein [Photobacterium lucens]MBP2701267.1 CHAD domain-containing protein [Vibrio parahaemolyticus]MZG56951.1 CHAD domain-containing protein [Photobacterium lucens]MZG82418.1 CHAD domain-containing protein [Photobacterium lucens]
MHKRDTFELPRKTSYVYPIHSKLPLALEIRRYLKKEFAFCAQYEKGIIKDDDPEFLHQYRVTLRRIRAILTLHRSLFDPTQVEQLKLAIKNLMQLTNLQRDLDVYLMQMEHYFSLIEHKHHLGLARFFDDLQHQRQKTYKKNKHWLKSDEYRTTYNEIALQLKHLLAIDNPTSPANITSINRLLTPLNKKVLKLTTAINTETEDSQLHALRIKCKKLRYGLELYASISDQITLGITAKTMKSMQSKLGDFNDSAVQIDFLNHYLEQYKKAGRRAKAINLLLHKIREQHANNKQQLIREIIQFSKTATNT